MTLTATAFIGTAAPTPEQMQVLVRNRPELDEIRWKDPARGAPLKVRIIQSNAQAITVEKTLPAGLVARVIPLGDLGGLSFTFTSGELELHRQPSAAAVAPLRVYWETRHATLRLPGSNAGETGLALARSLRLAGNPAALDEAGKILDQIRSQDPGKDRVDRARAEQTTLDFIRSMHRGKPAETDALAWAITEEPDHADAMLLATAFLAERHFVELRATEEAHPRWVDDDEVRPLRERLYHLSLDFSLYPSLFLGTRVAEASAGLKMAAAVHQFTGANLLAKNTLEDLAALYPNSEAAKEIAPLLARLQALDAAGKLSPDPVSADEEAIDEPGDITPTGPPPPPKRYNIFGD
ncbi:MAG: hypothetical protein WEB53_15755 [Akkermansiaceae bacterium]